MGHAPQVKGRWFADAGQPGDRTLKQQLMGLGRLMREVRDKSVLDVGCAEGLIALECAPRAKTVLGIEIRADAVEAAIALGRTHRPRLNWWFEQADANTYTPPQDYDVVLMLAILHKLKDPSAACARFAAHALDLVVIRLPPAHAPVVIDPRSGNTPHDIGRTMERCGFHIEYQDFDGPFGEWVGYYRRNRA